jgi:acyl-coenzyme A thioesterase PaaI-like protein
LSKSGERAAPFFDDGLCFACGVDSETGLKMRFVADADGVSARVSLPHWLQGWRGIAHGGIVVVLLDEAMAHAALSRGVPGVTAELTARFRRPVPLGEELIVRGRLLERRRSVLSTSADLASASGQLLATASARFMTARG